MIWQIFNKIILNGLKNYNFLKKFMEQLLLYNQKKTWTKQRSSSEAFYQMQ
jgi:hypothetical protein